MNDSSPILTPPSRIRSLNEGSPAEQGDFVLYWMVANRRLSWNFSLDRAVEWAKRLNKPLLILEALRCDYRWASERLHGFVIQGMRDNLQELAGCPQAAYFPYLEPSPQAGRGLLAALASRAAVIVSDDFPCFFIPRMLQAVAKRSPVLFEAVDSNGMLPMHSTDRVFTRAFSFRRHLQKELLPFLQESPCSQPFADGRLAGLPAATIPADVLQRWPAATAETLADPWKVCAALPIDHGVGRAPIEGGPAEARRRLAEFVSTKLTGYLDRNQPESDVSTGLSPYLHFGHVSAHEIWDAIITDQQWRPTNVAEKVTGSSDGWWGMSEAAEGFVDQLLTWRELGYNFCSHVEAYDTYESLPEWAITTLEEHANDHRPHLYDLEQLEHSQTHDPLWNAAQRQLVRDGLIHNYLRMLWGKKILQWTDHPRTALDVMIHLNNKYAVDGRNPNSYSGICWVLGRFDRAWGPEREIFGKIRYMASENTAKKIRVKSYLKTYAELPTDTLF